jgi:putative addiction module killer protein
MNRKIIGFGTYYQDFMATLNDKEKKKVKYVLALLATEDRLPTRFIKHIRDAIYELRTATEGNIYRIFFLFDEDKIVVLLNGFQKKTQKTPQAEIERAIKIKAEYEEYKRRNDT